MVVLLLFVLAAGAAWWFTRDGGSGDGRVMLSWRGSRIGEVTLPGRIAWCPITRLATLEAVSNDTGLVITLLETDTLTSGPHQAVLPAIRDQSPRPNAVAAMRWVLEGDTLIGFRSVSGVVDLTTTGGTAAGSLELRMQAAVGFDTLVLRGDFRDLPITASAVGCP
jgi:hypothetical protein